MRRRHRLTALLLSGIILLSTQVLALSSGRFGPQFTKTLEEAFQFLFRQILGNTVIRQGIALIALFIIFQKIFSTTLRKISTFSESANTIATALAFLSIGGIYWKVKPAVIDKLMIALVIGALLVFIIQIYQWISHRIFGGTDHNRVLHDERRIHNVSVAEENEDRLIRRLYDSAKDKFHQVRSEIRDDKRNIEYARSEIKAAQREIEEMKKMYNKFKRLGGGVI